MSAARARGSITRRTDGKGGLKGLQKRMEALGLQRVKVGVPGTATEADGTKIAMIAAVHEFGRPDLGIPERPFLRGSILASRQKYIKMAKRGAKKVAEGVMDSGTVYRLIGAEAVGNVQEYIRNADFVPLKPATIKRKGSSKPLIDTGQLRQSITYVVTED